MKNEACWPTHKQVGLKKKNGKLVPNCVPKEMTTTADAGIPQDTKNMGPKFKTKTIHDRRRKKKGQPVLLKRFRDYYQEKGIT